MLLSRVLFAAKACRNSFWFGHRARRWTNSPSRERLFMLHRLLYYILVRGDIYFNTYTVHTYIFLYIYAEKLYIIIYLYTYIYINIHINEFSDIYTHFKQATLGIAYILQLYIGGWYINSEYTLSVIYKYKIWTVQIYIACIYGCLWRVSMRLYIESFYYYITQIYVYIVASSPSDYHAIRFPPTRQTVATKN